MIFIPLLVSSLLAQDLPPVGGSSPGTGKSGAGDPNSICDKYTTALFKDNTEANQLKLLTTLVNCVVAGSPKATAGGQPAPTGILGKQSFMGQEFDLTGYFIGTYGRTQNPGNMDIPMQGINFFDGGGVQTLLEGKASNANGTRQQLLMNHLYQLFGTLTGCSQQGGQIFPNYAGSNSMTETHKFMNLNQAKISFFNNMVGQCATGFGVSKEDAATVGGLLEKTFNTQCGEPSKLVPTLDPGKQGFCLDSQCQGGDRQTCPNNTPPAGRTGDALQVQGGSQQSGQITSQQGVQRVIKCVPRSSNGSNGQRSGSSSLDEKGRGSSSSSSSSSRLSRDPSLSAEVIVDGKRVGLL